MTRSRRSFLMRSSGCYALRQAGARGSQAGHQPGTHCGSAIDRAIPRLRPPRSFRTLPSTGDRQRARNTSDANYLSCPHPRPLPFSWQDVAESVFGLPITPRWISIDKTSGGLSLEEPYVKNEKKITKKIAIDRSKLLGFRLEEATGAAGGAKLGGKVGGKIGAKLGLKRRRTS